MSQGTLLHSFRIQSRVIGALILREVITRYGRYNLGFLWLFIEPMLFTLAVVFLWSLTGRHGAGGVPIVEFAITGYSTILLWRNTSNRCASGVKPNIALMHHRNVRVMDIFLSRALLEVGGATMSVLVLTLAFCAAAWMRPPYDLLPILIGWTLLAWFGIALGLVIGALTVRFVVIGHLWRPMTYLFFPLSGAAFMVDWLPPTAREVVLWVPMVHGVEMIRGGYFGPSVRAHYDVFYLMAWCLGLTAIGLAMVRSTRAETEYA